MRIRPGHDIQKRRGQWHVRPVIGRVRCRITQGGTDAQTRVVIDHKDGKGRHWSTVGVSPNIVDASFLALLDAINWKLIRDEAKPA